MIATMTMKNPQLISYHGCHSGQFCNHAEDTLEDMVKIYVQKKFHAIGITDHMPPPDDSMRYPDEIEAGLSAGFLKERFARYCNEVGRLKKKYAADIIIYLAFETESYTGYKEQVARLIDEFKPDYIVGSVHHVDDLCFDYSREAYQRIANGFGSIDTLYHRYFDIQFDMIQSLEPSVVGHFDIVRIYDDDYKDRMLKPDIRTKILRNLSLIKDLDLIMDLNLRALNKGADEPYITRSILETARRLDIKLAPGEDSHCIKDIGQHIHSGINLLKQMGFSTDWPVPRLISYRT